MSFQQVLLSLAGALGLYAFYKIAQLLYNEWTSPLRDLPGPSSSSVLYGNMKEIFEAENSVLHEKWVGEYGSTIKYKTYFGANRLYTTDTKAINHVLMNDYIYQKSELTRFFLSRFLGNGVLVVEEDKHKQQRRIMNPAFGAAQIRELTEIFVDKSVELRDIWQVEVQKQGATGRVDVLSWLSKMTLDVIGQAGTVSSIVYTEDLGRLKHELGFNYKFNALPNGKNELNDAFTTLFKSSTRPGLLGIVRGLVPFLRPIIPAERDGTAKAALETMERIGRELLTDSKMGLMAEDSNTKMDSKSLKRRDLLSLLLRANVSQDLPLNQRMVDADVISQVPTFLVAGHETTSVATTFALYALGLDRRIQDKLREELLAVGTDNPTMDELNALPYLDAVVRETLRIHSPVGSTTRVAVKDDIIPLGVPIRDKRGKLQNSIRVRKGQTFLIPVLALNRAKSIWGGDALEFKPERWDKLPSTVTSIPGVWGNMMTFLGGPRACIGYRFSLVEMKALLFTLVRAFEFELAVPPEDIIKKSSLVQRPLVKSDPGAGNQMPMILKPVSPM